MWFTKAVANCEKKKKAPGSDLFKLLCDIFYVYS